MGAPNQLSFLPDDYLERKARRRANVLCGVLAILVMGAIGSAFSIVEKQMKEVEQRHVEVEKQYTEAARRIEQVNKMRAQQQQVVRRAELAASLVEKVPRSNILAEFTNALPPGVSLLDLMLESRERVAASAPAGNAFEQKKAALERQTAATGPKAKQIDVFLKVSGIATTDVQVAQFISKLNRSKLVKDVNLVVSEVFNQGAKASDEALRRFQIEMMVNPAAEVLNATPENTKTTAVEVGN